MSITRIAVSQENAPFVRYVDSMAEYVEGWRFWAEEPVKYVEYYDTVSGMDCRDELLVIDGERYIGTIMTERVAQRVIELTRYDGRVVDGYDYYASHADAVAAVTGWVRRGEYRSAIVTENDGTSTIIVP